jgi:hypothetical protein
MHSSLPIERIASYTGLVHSIRRLARRRRARREQVRGTWPPFRKAGDIWGLDFPVAPMRSSNWPIRLGRRV